MNFACALRHDVIDSDLNDLKKDVKFLFTCTLVVYTGPIDVAYCIRIAEEMVKSTVAGKAARRAISSRSLAVRPPLLGSPRFAGPSQAVDFAPPSNHWLLVSRRPSKTPARPGNCFAWGKLGHWRFEFVQSD